MNTPTRPAIFFDDGAGLLAPLTDLRAAFDVRTGALTTRDRWCRTLGLHTAGVWVPGHLAELLAEQYPGLPVNSVPDAGAAGTVLVINGRCALPPQHAGALPSGGVLLAAETGDLLAAHVRADEVADLLGRAWKGQSVKPQIVPGAALLARPWHVRRHRDAALDADLALLVRSLAPAVVPPHVAVVPGAAIAVAATARIGPCVVIDAEQGPVVIDEHATIRPGVSLIGPVYVGRHATILDRALVKGHTAIGPWCKVAGEVGGTIFQGFANKAHDGHLGDSWVGEWANLGAGTTNSNLLNTYGEVLCRPLDARGAPGPNERTGETFLGAMIGDHVKTAICTRLMTGCMLGTGTMLATTAAATGTVPAFSWCTDGGTRPFRFDKFAEVARAAMARRKATPGPAALARLRTLADLVSRPG